MLDIKKENPKNIKIKIKTKIINILRLYVHKIESTLNSFLEDLKMDIYNILFLLQITKELQNIVDFN